MNIIKLAISLLTVVGIGFLGSLVTAQSVMTWYVEIEKPFFTPPNWLFGPAWSLLYVLIAVTLYIAWENDFWRDGSLRTVFFGQLILNFLWTPMFFGLRSPLLGLIDILLLDIAVIFTIILLHRHSKVYLLLIPYLAWILFATALNLAILLLNQP